MLQLKREAYPEIYERKKGSAIQEDNIRSKQKRQIKYDCLTDLLIKESVPIFILNNPVTLLLIFLFSFFLIPYVAHLISRCIPNNEKRNWTDEMHRFAQQALENIPHRNTLTDIEEKQCQIISGILVKRLDRFVPRRAFIAKMQSFLSGRMMLNDMFVERCSVFTSDIPGIMAAREILKGEQVFFLQNDLYKSWLKKNPDPDFRCHIHYWLNFHETPASNDSFYLERLAEARRKNPIPETCFYWILSEGITKGGLAGTRRDLLFMWDGKEYTLLESDFFSIIS